MSVRVLCGDVREVLKTLPDASVHMACTSPPYFQLRDYKTPGQIGLEGSPDEYVATLVDVFREVWRVLRPDGTLWLNIGDSMAGSGKGKTGWNGVGNQEERQGFHDNYHLTRDNQARARWPDYAKPKDLLLIPFRLALALQAEGWYVRSDIAWCKRSCMPESVQDRPTSAWEHVFLLSKQPKYFYDSEAVAEEAVYAGQQLGIVRGTKRRADAMNVRASGNEAPGADADIAATRNMRNYWLLGPEPFSEAHFATYVSEIPRRAILAGTSERGCCPECGAPWRRVVDRQSDESGRESRGKALTSPRNDGLTWNENGGRGFMPVTIDTVGWRASCGHVGEPVPCTVLDPFAGAFTTALVAERLGRDSIMVEINPTYVEMGRKRVVGDAPMFTEVDVA